MTQTTPPESIPLQYGPRPALPWVSRHWGKLIGLAVLLAIAGTIYFYWVPLETRAKWLYWSHRCAVYQMPSQKEAQVMTAGISRNDPDFISYATSAGAEACFWPLPARELAKIDRRMPISGPTLFLGALHRPDGTPRLVCLSSSRGNGFWLLLTMNVTVLAPARLFDPLPGRAVGGGYGWSGGWIETTFFTGVSDPRDPSHIVLHFLAHPHLTGSSDAPVAGDIDAYLQNDDTIRFKLRDTPALREARIGLGIDHSRRLVDMIKTTTPVR